MRKIDEIIIHCSATKPGWMADASAEDKRDEIRRWHVEDNGWRDIGYHALIDRDGAVVSGRPIDDQGAHCRGHNATSLGVCLIGGFGSNENDRFDEHFTPEQNRALRMWIEDAKAKFGTISKVTGHNEYAAKACPGFPVSRWLANKPPKTDHASADPKMWAKATQVAGSAGGTLAAASQLEGNVQLALVGLAAIFLVVGVVVFRDDLREFIRRRRSA